MLKRAEGGLPVIEPVIEGLDAVQLGVRLEGLADFQDAVHAGRWIAPAELAQGLDGVVAGGFGVVLGGFDGGQVVEDDRALLVAGDRSILQDAEQGVPGLG
jgi:hypothetical protein